MERCSQTEIRVAFNLSLEGNATDLRQYLKQSRHVDVIRGSLVGVWSVLRVAEGPSRGS